MNTPNTSTLEPSETDIRYGKLSRTPTFRAGGFAAWSTTTLGIVGGGMLGGRLAREAVMSGVGEVRIWDFDRTEPHNLGNQFGRVGKPKVEYLVGECDAIRPGHARGYACDVRHAGIRQLAECDILVDCTDDPRLVWSLTEISNGVKRPLLRGAVDGTGKMELGRVLASGTSPDSACQLCSFSFDDLIRHRTPHACPTNRTDTATPTLAGGALAGAITSIVLLQAQRLQTGNDCDRVIDREVLLDLTNMQLLELRLERSATCLSGHRSWSLTPIDLRVEDGSFGDLFGVIDKMSEASSDARVPEAEVELSVYLHPLNIQAYCPCGAAVQAVGTEWIPAPSCPTCHAPMQWLEETQIDHLNRSQARDLGILDRSLASLGIPPGAMIEVRTNRGLLSRLVIS